MRKSCRVPKSILLGGLLGAMTEGRAFAAKPPDPGALVRTTASSTVGVLLDEIPEDMRARVASALVAKPSAFWKERAVAQLRLTTYRLSFRDFYYGASRKQLPLPPEPLWSITLVGAPSRATVGGHDVVKVDYLFSSTLLTDAASPAISEPRLRFAGGVWKEPFVFPIDPEMLLQRTGFACMDEEDFPFPSVDSEEADSFYDQDCKVERTLTNVGQCHATRMPSESCVEAVERRVGRVDTHVRYERLAWDQSLADQVRYGRVTGEEPDLEIYLPDFLPSRIVYKYVHDDGCDVEEQCVSGSGWRRLLQFATSDENTGNRALTIGGVDYTLSGKAGELDTHNLFEISECHRHFHFKYYGDFTWTGAGPVVNSKKGFCLQSTYRSANREGSPLHHPFGSCDFQGVEAGWLDQYKAGLPCQWLDISGFPEGSGTRSFRSNPLGLLCEGTFVDASGNPIPPRGDVVWRDTGLVAEDGGAVEAPLCDLRTGWDSNNEHSRVETIPAPGEGLITTPCTRGQIGPLRNCGLQLQAAIRACTPGETVRLTLSVPTNAPAQVARFCEFSSQLGSAIACRYEDTWVPLAPGVSDQPYTMGSFVVTSTPAEVSFVCPQPRGGGAPEPGGAFSLYTGPVFPDDSHAPIAVN